MRTPSVYLETSIFNFVFADDAPDKKQDTIQLFDEIKVGKYVPFTSVYVLRELNRAEDDKREKMASLIDDYGVVLLDASEDAEHLADAYIARGIIPAKYGADALHIAAASAADLDFIVSWNFKHIVKRKTVTLTEAVNAEEGYKKIGIYSPTEVIENDE
ncbi:MAG: hypothetical protein LBR73_02675 [Oscillospiraceae bacterium]|jgi:predicted nucleic acid-binding protein|nr:hypothetical protein [Oscillospiraceae bacterium]